MDHLPLPQDAAFPPVTVPYYDKYKYDGGSFTDYPVRCGFDKTKFIKQDFSTVPSDDHNSFFQAWLFFGLIHEFFGANLDEFIDHQEQRVTTARLPYWIAKWQQSPPIVSRSKRAECERLKECLDEVIRLIVVLDSRNIMRQTSRQECRSHLSEEVGVSIIVLGLTLEEVRDPNGVSTPVTGWPFSECGRKRLEAAGWCKSEFSRLQRYMTSTGILYCGSIRSFGRVIDHSRCSKDLCAAEDINEETYETAHVEGCNECEHDGPMFSDLKSVLDGKSFPVIGLTKLDTTSHIRISVQPHCKSMACGEVPYTAITHVWADGLGNPHGNTLPQCQILRLYQWLQSNNRASEGLTTRGPTWNPWKMNTVYLWIDTLCIPLQKELRKKAISLMYNIYDKAKTVLVVDRSLFAISAERPAEELCFRITASPWMRRAWTLQEGGLAKSLSVQFADRAIDVLTAIQSLFKLYEGTQSYNITLLESFSAIESLLSSGNSEDPDQLDKVFRGLLHRSTSHPEDKLICFAILMGHDMNRIMDAEGDFRTQRVYQQLKYIPRFFLWHDCPTLDIPGFRWAPKNILDSAIRLGELKHEHGLALSDRGLLVGAHGMVCFGPSQYMTKWVPHIRDFTSGKWYMLSRPAAEPFNGAVVKSDAPWTTLAIILKSSMFSSNQTGVVIRLDWNPSMATPQELSNYIRRCDTISGEYMGRADLSERNQIDTDLLEQYHVKLEKKLGRLVAIDEELKKLGHKVERQFSEDITWNPLFKGEMQGSEQKWCVT